MPGNKPLPYSNNNLPHSPMKKYICLNRVECNWADEKPPREFTLPEEDENVCPNCSSSNIREAQAVKRPIPVAKILAAVALLLLSLIAIWAYNSRKPGPGRPQSTDFSSTATNDSSNEQSEGKNSSNPPSPIPPPVRPTVTWIRVAGSDFCVDDCVVEYTEQDNLGHTRVRRIENYAKCCPAAK